MGNSTWSPHHKKLEASGVDDLAIDLGPTYGLYIRYNDSATWTKINNNSPELIDAGNLDGN